MHEDKIEKLKVKLKSNVKPQAASLLSFLTIFQLIQMAMPLIIQLLEMIGDVFDGDDDK